MKFFDQPPSTQWAALKYRGVRFADVWFKPADEPFGILFRIPRESFLIAGAGQRLTAENLLKAVAIGVDEVESWRVEGADCNTAYTGLAEPLAPPDAGHLTIFVNMKPPAPVAAPAEAGSAEAASAEAGDPTSPTLTWHILEARWRAITGVEAAIDNLRLMLESLLTQMETAAKKALSTEEKLHASKPDLAHWNKVRARVPFVVPKVREFVHRATWVVGTPERKKLEDLFKNEEQPELSFPEMVKLSDQLENLLKDHQVLSAHGVTVNQECRGVTTEIQSALQTLQSNAARNADRKRRAARPKGKFFKHVRKWSGAD